MKVLSYDSKDFWKRLEAACKPAAAADGVTKAVAEVIAAVRRRGDAAVAELTKKFDGVSLRPKNFSVSPEEFEAARSQVSPADRRQIAAAINCVKKFHARTKPKNWRAKNPHGATVGENFYPIRRVGIYVPGGTAPLVSTVVMTATLAKLAGCDEICVCTPPGAKASVDAHILCALDLLGVREVYKVGGAQAIAAMGIGTASIPRVDKIFGPGNAFVIEAKRQLFGEVGCDLLPGPSEELVVADASCNPRFVAADLLSQAEHGSGREKIYLVSLSKKLVDDVRALLPKMAAEFPRADKLMKIIEDGCCAAIVGNLEEAAKVANFVAPEHMELHVKNAEKLAEKIRTAGAILCGGFTPTVLGDFTAGPSHTLPTGGTGRFSSGLQLSDFMRRSSFVKYDKTSAARAMQTVAAFAAMEKLDAHSASLAMRLKGEK